MSRMRMFAPLLVGVVLVNAFGAAFALAAPAAEQRPVAAADSNRVVLDSPPAGGSHARGLRFTLLASLGVALAGGVVAQYQAVSGARRAVAPHQPTASHSRLDALQTPHHRGAIPLAQEHRGTELPDNEPGHNTYPGHRTQWPAAIREANRPLTAVGAPATRPVLHPVRANPARDWCEEAIAAAFVYDRARTVEAFSAALEADPGIQPTIAPGFWEMPSTGHADLARAYLRRGRSLDARTILTVALLTFEHNRELAALLRDTAPHWAA